MASINDPAASAIGVPNIAPAVWGMSKRYGNDMAVSCFECATGFSSMNSSLADIFRCTEKNRIQPDMRWSSLFLEAHPILLMDF